MSSQARIHANRLNAQESTGPKSPSLASGPVPEVATEQSKPPHAEQTPNPRRGNPMWSPKPSISERTENLERSVDLSGMHIGADSSPSPSIRYQESRILPILPPNKTLSAQNKPNPPKPKTNATPVTSRSYAIILLHPARKKQTQSNPIHPHREKTQNLGTKWKSRFIGAGAAEIGARSRHAGNAHRDPIKPNPSHTARHTISDIRHPRQDPSR